MHTTTQVHCSQYIYIYIYIYILTAKNWKDWMTN